MVYANMVLGKQKEGEGCVWGLVQGERKGVWKVWMAGREGLADHLCVNERGVHVMQSCGVGIHTSLQLLRKNMKPASI